MDYVSKFLNLNQLPGLNRITAKSFLRSVCEKIISQWRTNEWDGEDCANSAAAKRFMGNERGL